MSHIIKMQFHSKSLRRTLKMSFQTDSLRLFEVGGGTSEVPPPTSNLN